jgi:hypothetical protein
MAPAILVQDGAGYKPRAVLASGSRVVVQFPVVMPWQRDYTHPVKFSNRIQTNIIQKAHTATVLGKIKEAKAQTRRLSLDN